MISQERFGDKLEDIAGRVGVFFHSAVGVAKLDVVTERLQPINQGPEIQ